jgi:adenine phosphoribosyltransferase
MGMEVEDVVRSLIRDYPDFPKPGILFRDLMPVLRSPKGLRAVVDHYADLYEDSGLDAILAIESRGFPFGAVLADRLSLPLVLVRKPGKLPGETVSASYDLEYGSDGLEVQREAVPAGSRVLILDDLLATGGTLEACVRLAEEIGARVEAIACVVELTDLAGRDRLGGRDVDVIVRY